MFLKNTAGQFIHLQGVDSATGGIKSGVTWTVRRCIDGTFAAGGGTVTEDGTTGWYKYAMAQADTNGNNIGFNFTGSCAVPQTVNIVTTSLNPYDAVRFGMTALPNAAAEAAGGLYTRGSGAGQINQNANGQVDSRTVAMAADVVTAAAIANAAIDAATFAAGAVDAAALAADAGTEIAAAVWDRDATLSQTQGTFGQTLGDSVLDANTVYGAVVTGAAGATVAADVIAVQADTDNIQTRLPAALVGGRIDSSVGAVAADAITAAAIANGAIDAATFVAGAIDAAAVAADAGTEIAAAVWDRDATLSQTQGTFGQAIGDPVLDVDTIWGLANTNLDATVSSPATSAALTTVQADTDDIQTRLPAALVGGRIDASVGAIAANAITAAAIATDAITADKIAAAAITVSEAPNLDAAITTRATPAQVNTEVLDVLNTDTFAEPAQGTPAATNTLVNKISFLYKYLRNRITSTATTISVYNDDAVTVDHKSTHSDNGTAYDRGEFITGP